MSKKLKFYLTVQFETSGKGYPPKQKLMDKIKHEMLSSLNWISEIKRDSGEVVSAELGEVNL